MTQENTDPAVPLAPTADTPKGDNLRPNTLLSKPAARVIRQILGGRNTTKGIADFLGVSASAVSQTLKRLNEARITKISKREGGYTHYEVINRDYWVELLSTAAAEHRGNAKKASITEVAPKKEVATPAPTVTPAPETPETEAERPPSAISARRKYGVVTMNRIWIGEATAVYEWACSSDGKTVSAFDLHKEAQLIRRHLDSHMRFQEGVPAVESPGTPG